MTQPASSSTPSPAPAPAVAQDIALRCRGEGGRALAFITTFGYRAEDPYAVSLTFHVPDGDVEWMVARSLLHRGLTEPAGDGDVRLRPGLDAAGHAEVRLEFASPEGALVVRARTGDLLDFLVRTWTEVPAGAEDGRIDRDALVTHLLG